MITPINSDKKGSNCSLNLCTLAISFNKWHEVNSALGLKQILQSKGDLFTSYFQHLILQFAS